MSTIKDVARLAGVGVGTASRVISGHGSVAEATALRVKEAVAQLDFRPSHLARSLLSGTSRMVGVYIPMLKGTFYTPILRAIDMELRAAGLHMVVAFGFGAGDERQQAIEGIQFLIARGCDGLLVFSSHLQDADIQSLGPKKSRLAVLNSSLDCIANQCFTADHTIGGKLAAQALLERGHRSFAVVSGPASAADNIARVEGFLNTLEDAGIPRKDVRMFSGDYSCESGWAAAAALDESEKPVTALFCANDEMAVGALSYFQDVGINVPGTISVLGYDDTHSAEYSAPRLTSVHVPWSDITLNGLRWVLNQSYGVTHRIVKDFPISITWRSSVATV